MKLNNPGRRVLQPDVRVGVGHGSKGHDASDAAGEKTAFVFPKSRNMQLLVAGMKSVAYDAIRFWK